MFHTMLDLLFGCRHRRITRPITPVHRPGVDPGDTYVACLDCGRRLHYDLKNMRVGTLMRPTASTPAVGAWQSHV